MTLSGERNASVVLRAEGIFKALLECANRDKCIHDNSCNGLS